MTEDHRQQHNRQTGQKTTGGDQKLAPHNLEAEAALIGAAFLSAEALEILATKTTPEDYYSPAYQTIVRHIIALFEKGDPVDVMIVADSIARADEADEIGGTTVLTEMMVNTPSTKNADKYASMVHDDATLRRLLAASDRVADLAKARPFDVHGAVEAAQNAIGEVASQNGSRSYSSLEIPDMALLVSEDFALEQPTILERSDGQCLFYAAKMHVIQAEPSTGKSWIALFTAVEVMSLGGTVVYIDYEDSPATIRNRLLALGTTPSVIATQFQYIRPHGAMGKTERVELLAWFQKLNPDLCIIDGVAEALSREGLDEDKNVDVIKWTDSYPRWVAEMGSAVVMLDHVTKDPGNRQRYARGAGSKLAVIDGAAYSLAVIKGYSRHKSGSMKLTIAKDRPGAVGEIKSTAGMFKVQPSADGEVVRMRFEPFRDDEDENGSRPTRTMEAISLEVESYSHRRVPITKRVLLDLFKSHKKHREAFTRLIADHYLDTYRSGSTELVRLIAPYREGDAPRQPPAEQKPFATEWLEHQDKVAKRRIHNQEQQRDAHDPGPREPTD